MKQRDYKIHTFAGFRSATKFQDKLRKLYGYKATIFSVKKGKLYYLAIIEPKQLTRIR